MTIQPNVAGRRTPGMVASPSRCVLPACHAETRWRGVVSPPRNSYDSAGGTPAVPAHRSTKGGQRQEKRSAGPTAGAAFATERRMTDRCWPPAPHQQSPTFRPPDRALGDVGCSLLVRRGDNDKARYDN